MSACFLLTINGAMLDLNNLSVSYDTRFLRKMLARNSSASLIFCQDTGPRATSQARKREEGSSIWCIRCLASLDEHSDGIKKLLSPSHEKEDMTSFKCEHLRAGYAGMHLFR